MSGILDNLVLFFPQSSPTGETFPSALIKSICLYHRTCSAEDLMPHKRSSETWPTFTSGIGNYPWGRFTT